MLQLYTETSRPNYSLLHDELNRSMQQGILIDPPAELVDKMTSDKQFMLHKMQKQHNIANPNSPDMVIKQLQELSYEYPEIREACYDAKSNKWTSNGNALKQLSSCNIDMVNDLTLYRSVTSITKALGMLDKFKDSNGYVHPNLTSQATHRVGYEKPGIMLIPKAVLWNVVKPRTPGWSIIKIDIRNQEPWIFINALKIEKLRLVLEISGEIGLYRMLYHDIYGVDPSDVQYQETKRAWNSLTYGGSKQGLISRTFTLGQTLDKCSDRGLKLYQYFNSFPEIKEYQKQMSGKAYGKVRTIKSLFGSEMSVGVCPDSLAKRRLMDYWVQGTGADVMCFLTENFLAWRAKYHLEDHIRLYYERLDELDLEVSPEFINYYTLNGVYDKLNYVFRHTIDDWKPCQLEIEQVVKGQHLESIYSEED